VPAEAIREHPHRPGSHAQAHVRGRRPAWRDGWWWRAQACPSPNHNERPAGTDVSLAVVHSISLPPGQYGGDAIERLFTNRLDWSAHPYFESIRGLQVSAHFVVLRSGRLLQFVSCDRRAWHAGASQWRGRDNCNDYSVGIELEGLEGERFKAAQYAQLVVLLRALARRYAIAAVVGHEHVAPTRKHDPGKGFDWARLARALRWSRARVPFAPAEG
jgi:AmpD protein